MRKPKGPTPSAYQQEGLKYKLWFLRSKINILGQDGYVLHLGYSLVFPDLVFPYGLF